MESPISEADLKINRNRILKKTIFFIFIQDIKSLDAIESCFKAFLSDCQTKKLPEEKKTCYGVNMGSLLWGFRVDHSTDSLMNGIIALWEVLLEIGFGTCT